MPPAKLKMVIRVSPTEWYAVKVFLYSYKKPIQLGYGVSAYSPPPPPQSMQNLNLAKSMRIPPRR
ncbi:hypothetical protein GIB67_026350 [Kingdonia uniflora]|uniref:Uncharacterized protein n=1 Tax=Kingdonia uniflora TaxID=39325 RepID=A0A7J7P6F4_9MAGN|nr:hypothetical protein GIB67_026350 [Kingdonia uniflora]